MRTTLCVEHVDTLAATLAPLHPNLLTAEKRLDVAELRALSNQAVRAQRYVEQANAGPALPQRMGRQRIPDSEPLAWEPITPPRVECDEGLAYARVRLDLPAPTSGQP